MNRANIFLLILLLLNAFVAGGCMDDDETTTSLSNECALTAITLGTLNRTLHTQTAAGEDSTFVVTVTGSLYPLYIDHVNSRVYNPDSLPVGTDVSKVVFSQLSALGYLWIDALTTEGDTTFLASDSTDFTKPRRITVQSYDLSAKREYEIKVNVHREEADTFVWRKAAAFVPCVVDLQQAQMLCTAGRLLLFGHVDGMSLRLESSTTAPEDWHFAEMNRTVGSVCRFDSRFVGLSAGEVVTSDDGLSWQAVEGAPVFDLLLAAGTRDLYAVREGKIYHTTDLYTWTEDSADTPAMLPEADVVFTCQPSAADKWLEDLLVVGRRADSSVVWKKNVDLSGAEAFPWNFYPEPDATPYPCPVLQGASLATYDGKALLAGLKGDGSVGLYLSRDNGRTWMPQEIKLPAFGAAPSGVSICVDAEQNIWMACQGTGEVWKGRHNRLGWTQDPTVITRSARR